MSTGYTYFVSGARAGPTLAQRRARSLTRPTPYTHTHRTGASRSLGLGYVEKLLASSPSVKVVAGARNPSNAAQLDALASKPENKGRVLVVAFDVDSEDSVRSAADKLKTEPFLDGGALDAVVVNAGVFVGGHKPPSEMCVGATPPRRTQLTPLRGSRTMDDVRANFRTNVEGAIYTVRYLLPLLERGKGKQIFFISSIVASFQEFYSTMAGGVSCTCARLESVGRDRPALRRRGHRLDEQGGAQHVRRQALARAGSGAPLFSLRSLAPRGADLLRPLFPLLRAEGIHRLARPPRVRSVPLALAEARQKLTAPLTHAP